MNSSDSKTSLSLLRLSRYFMVMICIFTYGCSTGQDLSVQAAEATDKISLSSQLPYGVASAHPLASKAGMDVLAEGGNAFDAAVAVTAVLAVVEPFGSGIGGGGFWLLHEKATDTSVFVDGRETAPLASTETMFQDDTGEVIRELAVNHPLAAAIPGTPAAMVHVQSKYGTLPLKRLLAPAIRIAQDGFPVSSEYSDAIEMRYEALTKWPDSSVFLDQGKIPQEGWILRQPHLAETLQKMAENGADGFYKGKTAKRLVESVQNSGGIWTLKDLAAYKVKERTPIVFNYGDYKITSAPLPSSGGLVLGSLFSQLDQLQYDQAPEEVKPHLFIEAMRTAYYQRALYMGDSDFTGDDGRWLLEGEQVNAMANLISPRKALVSSDLKPVTSGTKGDQTTHFSIIDKSGNRASVTLSINLYFGNGFVAGDTGVLLNNEMDDFSAKPGAPNAYGLVGSAANRIEPGKRPLSSMSPSFLEGPEGVYVLGTPGGSRIISMVAYAMLSAMNGLDPEAIVARRRIHHQFLPDSVFYEPEALTAEQLLKLENLGHELRVSDRLYGDMQLLFLSTEGLKLDGGSDPRGEGEALISKD